MLTVGAKSGMNPTAPRHGPAPWRCKQRKGVHTLPNEDFPLRVDGVTAGWAAERRPEDVIPAARTDAFSCIFLEGEEIYINCINEMTRQFIRDLSIPMPLQRPADYARGREVYQAVTFLTREREHLLLDRAPHLKTTRWHPNFLDVIPPSGGKDRGMDALLDYFRIPVEDAMAFGDGENDLSMLLHAGIGVAMGSAHEEMKRQVDWVTGTADEDGVVQALAHFGLI